MRCFVESFSRMYASATVNLFDLLSFLSACRGGGCGLRSINLYFLYNSFNIVCFISDCFLVLFSWVNETCDGY